MNAAVRPPQRPPATYWGPGLSTAKTAADRAAQAVNALYGDATRDSIRAAADLLDDALNQLRMVISGEVGRTGCIQHPTGHIDPDPPPGWGRCAMCNTNRARALPPARVPDDIREALRATVQRARRPRA